MITRITKETAQRRLGDIPEEKVFWVKDGRVLKNLKELERALNEMSDDTFNYHYNGSKSFCPARSAQGNAKPISTGSQPKKGRALPVHMTAGACTW